MPFSSSSKPEKRAAQRYGQRAERLAALYLRAKGYRILGRNVRNAYGEIDILAHKRGTLIAVEVKARQKITDCHEAISPHQRQRIARALEAAIAGKSAGLAAPPAANIRFDVIWLAPRAWPVHIKDAWRI